MHKVVLTYNVIILSLSLHLNRSYTSYKLLINVVVLQFDEMMNFIRFKPTIQLIVVLFIYLQTHHLVDCWIVDWLKYYRKCCRNSQRNRLICHFHAKTSTQRSRRPCKNIRRCDCCCLLRLFTIPHAASRMSNASVPYCWGFQQPRGRARR